MVISRSFDVGDVVTTITIRTLDVKSHSRLVDRRAELEALIERLLVIVSDDVKR